jgi:hypothetical protein
MKIGGKESTVFLILGEFFCIFDIIIFCLSMTPPLLKMFPFSACVSLIHYKIGLDRSWNDAHENGLFDTINITPCFDKCQNKTNLLLLTFTQEYHEMFQNILFSTFNAFKRFSETTVTKVALFKSFLEYIKIFIFEKKTDSSSLRSSSKTPY